MSPESLPQAQAESPRSRGRSAAGVAATVLAIGLALLGFFATLWRVFYGVDFIDEAFYAALAYRFAVGARPLLDIPDPHQTAALLVAPYVKLHLKVFGDTTGIMLSLRLLWLLLNGATAALWFFMLKKVADWRVALVASTAAFCVIPYMIPAPSFNTLPVFFGSMAVATIGLALEGSRARWTFFVAGALLGIATFAYPPLVVGAGLMLPLLWWATRETREVLWFGAGGVVAAALLLLPMLPYLSGLQSVVGMTSNLSATLSWGGSGAGGPITKLVQIFLSEAKMAPRFLSLYVAAAIAFLSVTGRRTPWWLFLLLVASLPIAAPSVLLAGATRTLMLSTSIVVAAAIITFTARDEDSLRRRFFRLVLMYGLGLGLVFAVASSQGWLFLGLGCLVAMPSAVSGLLERLRAAILSDTRVGPGVAVVASVSAASILILGLVVSSATGTFQDELPWRMHTRVRVGPHAGLVTTAANARGTEGLWRAMQRYSGPRDRILSYHTFPAGYLYTKAAPALPDLWTRDYDSFGAPAQTAVAVSALSSDARRPTVVIQNLGWPSAAVLEQLNPAMYDASRDVVQRLASEQYEVVASGGQWRVLRLRQETGQ